MQNEAAKKKILPLILSLAISLGTGALAGALTANAMERYQSLPQPPLSPPGWVFPVVWTVLFTLMGIGAWLVYLSDSEYKRPALTLYFIQLAVNFVWPILFFNAQAYGFALVWLIFLWLLVLSAILLFKKADKRAAWMLAPYLIWLTFAAYLNAAVLYIR